jgi:hypothetical protein
MPRKIYRIENPKTMHGMWHDNEGNFKPTIHDLCPNSIAKDFPIGPCSDHQKDGKTWYSAGKSKENMQYWFSKEDAKNLIDNGFKLYEFEVSEWMEKEYEILFTREGIVSTTIIDYEEIWRYN